MAFTIFTRTWYKADPNNRGKLIPNPGARRTIVDTASTREDAIAKCKAWNEKNKPGKYSRKAEFTEFF